MTEGKSIWCKGETLKRLSIHNSFLILGFRVVLQSLIFHLSFRLSDDKVGIHFFWHSEVLTLKAKPLQRVDN